MQHRATLLHAHVVASTQDLAILRDQAGANGDAALGGALFRLFHSRDETGVLLHSYYMAIELVLGEISKGESRGMERGEV
jgi:hypothetical protein